MHHTRATIGYAGVAGVARRYVGGTPRATNDRRQTTACAACILRAALASLESLARGLPEASSCSLASAALALALLQRPGLRAARARAEPHERGTPPLAAPQQDPHPPLMPQHATRLLRHPLHEISPCALQCGCRVAPHEAPPTRSTVRASVAAATNAPVSRTRGFQPSGATRRHCRFSRLWQNASYSIRAWHLRRPCRPRLQTVREMHRRNRRWTMAADCGQRPANSPARSHAWRCP
mmetsp:Transcript_4077/g.13451  ORF Transcript_4077/g.13451 Transcript_4077/m.13451 type:complete len:237 (+) Transcript_4077:72-782(+)